MAKMVPKIVKNADTLNRHLRVCLFISHTLKLGKGRDDKSMSFFCFKNKEINNKFADLIGTVHRAEPSSAWRGCKKK